MVRVRGLRLQVFELWADWMNGTPRALKARIEGGPRHEALHDPSLLSGLQCGFRRPPTLDILCGSEKVVIDNIYLYALYNGI